MTTKQNDSVRSILVIYLEEKHRELVQSQFSDALETSDANALYRAFLEDTITACLAIDSLDLAISSSPGMGARIATEAIENLSVCLKGKCKTRLDQDCILRWDQPEAGLSQSLELTFKKCFGAGYDQALLIDCVTPTITQQMLDHAQRLLCKKDVIFGPTLEGSYYLIGMRKFIPQIFTRIDWSEDEHIYSRIVEVAREDSLNWEELELWYDLRQPGDLEFLVRDINAFRIIGDEFSAKRTETVLETLIEKFQREET